MIINMTQHTATKDQVAEGVVEIPEGFREEVVELLNFVSPPTGGEILLREGRADPKEFREWVRELYRRGFRVRARVTPDTAAE